MLRKRRNGSESQKELHNGGSEPVNDETGISSGCGLVDGAVSTKDNHEDDNDDDDDDNEKKRLLASSPPLSLFHEGCQNSRRINNVGVCTFMLATTTLHVAACLFYAFGFYLAQTRLYTHDECDMTYSRRQFIQLKLNDKSRSLPLLLTRDGTMQQEEEEETDYRLFKFFDQRDPRHVNFLHVHEEQALGGDDDDNNNNNNWCTLNVNRTTVPILYVPGHAGSFQQSRSIGAHGLGLTSRFHGTNEQKIVQALGAATAAVLTGHDALDINHFIYDVYALDFREQGSGLHGALLEEQARFLTRCIHHLVTSCGFSSSVYIVAHSLGGIVTRLAMTRYADIMQPNVHSIVTLGTPHAHPIVAWDSSIHSIYQELSSLTTTDTDNVLLISISGGLRDEMIPPTSCIINDKKHDMVTTTSANSLTLLGPQHMVAGTVEARGVSPSLGMDHRAIVWCHNLLSTVRSILYILAKTEYQQQQHHQQLYLTPRERLDRVKAQLGISGNGNGSDDYLSSVQDMRRSLRQRFGPLVALAMETGLVYNLELLVGLFTALAAWYTVLEKTIPWRATSRTALHWWVMTMMLTVPSMVIVHCCYNSDWLSIVSLPSIVVLTLLANTIFWTLHFTIKFIFRFCGRSGSVKMESSAPPVNDNRLQENCTHITSLGIQMTVLASASLTIAYILYVVLNGIRHYNHKMDDEQGLAVVFAVNPLTLLVLSSKLFLGAVAMSAAATACQQSLPPEVENGHNNKNRNLSKSNVAFSMLILLTACSGLEIAYYLPALLPILFMRAALFDTSAGIVDDQRRTLLAFVVWVLVLLPVFSAGEFYLVAVRGSLYRSNATAQLVVWTIPLTMRLIFAHEMKTMATVTTISKQRKKNRVIMDTAFQVLRVFVILRWSKVIFKMGVGSHPLFGHHHSSLLSAFSIVDLINELARLTS